MDLSYLYSVCSGIGPLVCPKTVGCHFLSVRELKTLEFPCKYKGGYTLVTLPHIVTPYRDSKDGTCNHVTCQKLVTR